MDNFKPIQKIPRIKCHVFQTSARVTWPHTAPVLHDAHSLASPAAAWLPASLFPLPVARPSAPASQPQSETAPSAAAGGSAPALPSWLPPPPAACDGKHSTDAKYFLTCLILFREKGNEELETELMAECGKRLSKGDHVHLWFIHSLAASALPFFKL